MKKRMLFVWLIASWCGVEGMDLQINMTNVAYSKLLNDLRQNVIPSIFKKTGTFPNIGYPLLMQYLRPLPNDAEGQYHQSYTRLFAIIRNGTAQELEALLADDQRAKACINIYFDSGEPDKDTPLELATFLGKSEFVAILLGAGADVNALSGLGRTALIEAAMKDHSAIALSLINNGADTNFKNPLNGWTALIFAADNGSARIIELLIKKGVKIDEVDHDGNTALFHAAVGYIGYKHQEQRAKILELLLDAGADLMHKNYAGEDIEQFFIKNDRHGGDPDRKKAWWHAFLKGYLEKKTKQSKELQSVLPKDIADLTSEYLGDISSVEQYLYPEMQRFEEVISIFKNDPRLVEKIRKNKDAILKNLSYTTDIDRAHFSNVKAVLERYATNPQRTIKSNDMDVIISMVPELAKIMKAHSGVSDVYISYSMFNEAHEQSLPNRKTIDAIIKQFNKVLKEAVEDKQAGLQLLDINLSPMLFNRVPETKTELNRIIQEAVNAATGA